MRKSLAIIPVLLVALSVTADDRFETLSTQNGRAWTGMSLGDRVIYLHAFRDAMTVVSAGGEGKTAAEYYMCKCTFGELAEGITALYASDPAYSRVPIYFMLGMFGERTRGATKEDVEKRISGFLAALDKSEK